MYAPGGSRVDKNTSGLSSLQTRTSHASEKAMSKCRILIISPQ